MIVEIGHFALILAACVALVQGVLPLAGTLNDNQRWQALAKPAATLQFLLIAFSFAVLAHGALTDDFSIKYIAGHSNSLLPTQYKFASVWGGHEGSLLLWMLMLSGWTLAVAIFSRTLPLAMVARVIGILGLVSTGFLMFILITSSPFERLLPAPADGKDLNPLLQDPGLVIHPPMLYMGYVGFSVAFAFAVAALLSGRMDAAWARWSRPWTIVAWIFMTAGIALGSWWAYYELGWGGWWFWDPVENASLMPWLFGTALIHALMVTDKRGGFKAWSVLLAIGAFSLSLLGTFLVRSGVLTSVHAFASDPKRGVFILIFLAVVVGVSLTLFAWRAPKATLGGKMGLVSRESMLIANSVLLVVATGAVLLGTIYPLIVDALNLGKLSVGAPYFNAVFVPLMVPVVFLMVPGGIAHWREARWAQLGHDLRWPALAAVVAGVAIWTLTERGTWLTGMGMALATWVVVGLLMQIAIRMKKPGRIAPSFWGMHLAHLGIAVITVGITMVKTYEVERDVRMGLNDTVTIENYSFELVGVSDVDGPNYKALRGDIKVTKDGKYLEMLYPEKRKYFSSAMPMTEAGIDSGLFRDLYVSLGEPIEGERMQWSVRVFYKPFVSWLWYGSILMVLGGLLAVSDRRYRKSANSIAQ
ncbi:heme lyase CcmF/NrfE family subunit [Limnohabitans sp. MMS-10A-178]|uniref:heme lyase CcmF/NrfE family subunit n=1 Tax=Limnohabitans sp. MMS-10A-178 TaxID=1835767 RepID=UPI000D39C6ED|nr:heme lyase CcmF/NrfE family subunit [Limnohabitans sp. MMS-10A-178]PUE16985.1 c-type cytochrome biogenesis protein CcmF [Limnohabitans sp. MMS-10A-178]